MLIRVLLILKYYAVRHLAVVAGMAACIAVIAIAIATAKCSVQVRRRAAPIGLRIEASTA